MTLLALSVPVFLLCKMGIERHLHGLLRRFTEMMAKPQHGMRGGIGGTVSPRAAHWREVC